MSLSTRVNSAEAQQSLQISPLAGDIMALFGGSAKLTRRAIAIQLGREPSSCTAAISLLMERGYLRETDSIECPYTGRMVVQYTLTAAGDALVYGEDL